MGFRLSGSPPCVSILVLYVILITANKFLLLPCCCSSECSDCCDHVTIVTTLHYRSTCPTCACMGRRDDRRPSRSAKPVATMTVSEV